MSFTIKGEEELERRLLSLGADMEDALKKGVLLTAQQVRTHAIKSITEVSQGATVRRSRQGGGTYPHVASSGGDAPNTDTGALVASISAEMDRRKPQATVGSGIKYASFLEFGTKKMEERPFLHPALDKNKNNLVNNVKKVLIAKIKALSK